MGTRHLISVRLKDKVKIAQYGQWDGYPTGQGAALAKFIQSAKFDLKKLKKNLASVTFITPEEHKARWTECGAKPDSDFVSMDVFNKFSQKYPWLSRDTGAKILEMVQSGIVDKVENSSDFINDSLFCEYAYEVDLDKKKVHVFKGFQSDGKGGYLPCKKIKTYSFKAFTVAAMAKLEKELSKQDEE